MTVSYASIEQSNSTGKWYVMPMTLGFMKAMERQQAEQIVHALNTAYDRGRSNIRAELRDLIGAASQELDT